VNRTVTDGTNLFFFEEANAPASIKIVERQ
jgi:hypothetical protein